jgi:head-tail adaptor
MRLKTGDKVRFLNEAIEGTITRLLSNSRVEVTDSHGFSHVSEERDLVLVELVLDRSQLNQDTKIQEKEDARETINAQHASPEMVQSLELDHTIYAAIRLMNEKSPLTTDIELHLVNNTQLTICFTIARRHDDLRTGVGSGTLKPRNEQFIGIFSQDELHRFNGFEFQFLFFGKNEFKPRPPAVKGLQFSSSDFMNTDYRKLFYKKDDTVLLMPLYVLGTAEYLDVSKLLDKYKREAEEEQKRATALKGKNKEEKFTVLTRNKVVDLHIDQLLKDYSSMSNAQIISYQLNYFLYEMDQAVINKLHKITFIHGVGNGVLRSSIRDQLKHFPNIRFYEAPQEKYGYGATEVEFL